MKNSNDTFNLNEQLVRLRKRDGHTQKEVAEFLGVDVTTYSRYEAGQRTPDAEKLRKLAEYYGTTDELLGATLPIVTTIDYTADELDAFQKVLEECDPNSTDNFFELQYMYRRLQEAFRPINQRHTEACEFPNISLDQLLSRAQFAEENTVQKIILNPRAEYLTQVYFKLQSRIMDKMMGNDRRSE